MDHGSPGQPLTQSSLSGSWILDVERSDTLEDYLRCLLVPEAVIQCQVVGEQVKPSRNTIALNRFNLFIHQNTAIHDKADNFELDEEEVIESDEGDTQLSTVSLGQSGGLDGFVRMIRSQSAQGRIVIQVEARQLSPGGSSHTQELQVQDLGNRYLLRSFAFLGAPSRNPAGHGHG